MDIIYGKTPERIPAIFRLEPWYNYHAAAGTLPDEIRGISLDGVQEYLGLGISARKARVFDTRIRPGVECIEHSKGDEVFTEWRTPAGDLHVVRRYGPGDQQAGLTPTIVEYPIKSLEDYDAYMEIIRHTEYIPDYDGYADYENTYGDRGLPLVILAANPFHDLFLRWVGYQQGFLDLFDRPDVFLSAAEAANEHFRRTMWQIVAESPAKLVMYGVNFDMAVTPPGMFREHFLPHLSEFNRLMHESGKKVAFHGDGDMTGLLDLMVEAGYDVADCFACKPMGKCPIEEAWDVWKDRITIWGGLPSYMLDETFPLEGLRDHLEMLYRTVAPGNRFILGIADQALPTATWERIVLTARWAVEHEPFPISL